ncbi:MAG: hypothetical protein WAX04_01875, partial [Oscillospiraceae bacterium]
MKHIILTCRYIKNHIIRIVCYALSICLILACYFIGENYIGAYYKEEAAIQASAKAKVEVQLQDALTAKEEKRVAQELTRIEAERIEAERIEAIRVEAERVEAERVKAERIEAARKEAIRVAAQKEKQRKRAQAAKAEALRKEVI